LWLARSSPRRTPPRHPETAPERRVVPSFGAAPAIIRVDKRYKLAACFSEAQISCRAHPVVCAVLVLQIADPIGIPSRIGLRDRGPIVFRAVVYEKQLKVLEVLLQDAFDGFRQIRRGILKDRNNRNTGGWSVRRRAHWSDMRNSGGS
jgi:hypothetical protein